MPFFIFYKTSDVQEDIGEGIQAEDFYHLLTEDGYFLFYTPPANIDDAIFTEDYYYVLTEDEFYILLD